MSETERQLYAPTVQAAASRWGISAAWLDSILGVETDGYNPDVISGHVQSSAGATGIAQFMPATARQYGVDVRDPISSIDGAAHYLADLLTQFGGSTPHATAAYNAGPGNVSRAVDAANSSPGVDWRSLIPTETQRYLDAVLREPPHAAGTGPQTIGFPLDPGGLVTGAMRIFDPNFWARIGLTIAGAGMILIGVLLYLHEDIERGAETAAVA